jgi:hypothetical protein
MLCAPLIVPPLTPWTRKVRVRGQLSGATVIVFANGIEVGRGQVGGPDGFVGLEPTRTLSPGDRVTARQELDGDHSVSTPPTSAAIVLKAPSVEALAKLFSRSPLYQCGKCLWLEGIVPGTEVTVAIAAYPPVTVHADWTAVHVDVPMLSPSLAVVAHQWSASLTGSPVSLPTPLAQSQGQAIEPPSVELPLYACDRSLKLMDVQPGATVTVDHSGVGTEFCFGAPKATFWLSEPLKRDDRVVVKQEGGPIRETTSRGDAVTQVDLLCALAAGDQLHLEIVQCGNFRAIDDVVVVQPAPPDLLPPHLGEPLDDCGGTIWVSGVEPGAIVDVEQVASEQAIAGTLIVSQPCTQDVASAVSSVAVPPLPPGTLIRARQRLCGQMARLSNVARIGDRLLSYKGYSTDRICQLTGWRGNGTRPPRLNTEPIGLIGTDLGIPVVHQGRLYFFFGDCDAAGMLPYGHPMEADADPIAWTVEPPETPGGPMLHWLLNEQGSMQRLHVDGLD